MLDWILGWSAPLAFVLALCAPIPIGRYGTSAAKWSILLVGALCVANGWYSWNTDFDDGVLVGTSNAVGILMSIAVFVFSLAIVIASLAFRKQGRSEE